MTTKKSNFPNQKQMERKMKPLIEKGFDEFMYRPKQKHRLAKARLMTAIQSQPLLRLDELSCGKVEQIVGMNLRNEWRQPGFQEWLLNRNEYEEKLEMLFSLALDAAENILQNADPKAQSARVQMIKVVAELANKMPDRWSKKDPIKDTLDSMGKDEIEDLLSKHGLQLTITAKHDAEPIDVTPSQTDTDRQ